MKMKGLRLLVLCFGISSICLAQQPDTLIKKLDSLSIKTDSAGGQVNNINPKAYNEKTKITFATYFILLGSDFKQQFTAPFHMTGRDWGKVGQFAVVAGALAFADKPIQRFGLHLRNSSTTIKSVSRDVTNVGGLYEIYTLAALGAYGYIFKNEKIRTTTLLATQSYITSGAVSSVIKFVAGRERPYSTDPTALQPRPVFHGPFYKGVKQSNGKRLNNSFPSGHTTAAFSAATVFALEYKDRPLIPILSYTAASLIGLSRITENKHWATDVLTGAALGFLTGRQVVNNYHRYAKIKAPRQKKNTVSFNLQYNDGVVMPGVVYHFR
ncbi:MAG TPA: phosphatase PAP2 family protein [Chitinophagaceae bacterium]|nr:phosphatase PAP2 family protein [Chitinophagaceae bacterium]